jgi:hypothetical protein
LARLHSQGITRIWLVAAALVPERLRGQLLLLVTNLLDRHARLVTWTG